MRDLSDIRRTFEEGFRQIDELIEQLKIERDNLRHQLEERIEQLQFTDYDLEGLEDFLEEPYYIIPRDKDKLWIIVPKFVNLYLGWLEHETRSFRVFAVNRYMQWLTPLPEEIRSKLKFEEQPPFKVFDGILLTGRAYQDEAWKRYRKFLLKREGEDRIRVKKGYEFKLIAKLVEDGILPFIPQPVDPADLREWDGIKLRDYQQRAWQEFLDKGAVGIFWSFGAGKSHFGLYALARIKGPKLVVVNMLTLKEQWEKNIEKFIPEYADEITVITYHSFHKVQNREYSLIVFDEVHHLPAPRFIRLSTVKTKYRIGLSGSPFREDGKENYIFALTGFPIGLSWDELLRQRVVKQPTFRVYIVRDYRDKMKRLEELLSIPVKTLIFSDSIEMGKKISRKFDIPFVYGDTKDRLEIIRNSLHTVVSRVGDEGISIPDIERVIEFSFLYGSRMQESQRYGRLMHARKDEPQHIILMTEEEFENYQKRLYAITERGFKIEVVR
jgi:DNA excision repair protein ERCC-3